jgi:hypothetical protein
MKRTCQLDLFKSNTNSNFGISQLKKMVRPSHPSTSMFAALSLLPGLRKRQIVILVVLFGLFFLHPTFTLYKVRLALAHHDDQTLNRYVDFENVRNRFAHRVGNQAQNKFIERIASNPDGGDIVINNPAVLAGIEAGANASKQLIQNGLIPVLDRLTGSKALYDRFGVTSKKGDPLTSKIVHTEEERLGEEFSKAKWKYEAYNRIQIKFPDPKFFKPFYLILELEGLNWRVKDFY